MTPEIVELVADLVQELNICQWSTYRVRMTVQGLSITGAVVETALDLQRLQFKVEFGDGIDKIS